MLLSIEKYYLIYVGAQAVKLEADIILNHEF